MTREISMMSSMSCPWSSRIERIRLTTREADLLSYLAERAGRDVSRTELQTALWGQSLGKHDDQPFAEVCQLVDQDGQRARQRW